MHLAPENIMDGGGASIVQIGSGPPDLAQARDIESLARIQAGSRADIILVEVGEERCGVALRTACLFKDFSAAFGGFG